MISDTLCLKEFVSGRAKCTPPSYPKSVYARVRVRLFEFKKPCKNGLIVVPIGSPTRVLRPSLRELGLCLVICCR